MASTDREAAADRPHLSRGEYVHQKLLGAIRSGRYSAGERVREAEVADWLSVSRTPVREAFRRLQSDGLLVFTPWRGVIVAELDQQQVIELYAMRRVLEGTAARLAAQHAADSEIANLEEIHARAAAAHDDPDTLADLNQHFHHAIYSAAHNRYLLKALSSLRDALALLRPTTYTLLNRPDEAQAEHARVLEAIRARDAETAEQVAHAHLAQAERARLKLMFDAQKAAPR